MVSALESTVDSVGRFVVPKAFRDALGLRAGTKVDISQCGAGWQVIAAGRTGRLPGEVRLHPRDAARLLDERFEAPIVLPSEEATRLPQTLAELSVSGGAVYDAIDALAAATEGVSFSTRNARAKATYDAVGVVAELVV